MSTQRKWPADLDILYQIVNPPEQGLTEKEVEDAFEKAFIEWSKGVKLPFSFRRAEIDESPNLFISWKVDLCDGEDGIIAYADYPPPGGEGAMILFNEGLDWSVSGKEFRILPFALHELGHTIGLGHSANDKAVMCDCINSTSKHSGISIFDEEAIVQHYKPSLVDKVLVVFKNALRLSVNPERTFRKITYRGKHGVTEGFIGYGESEILTNHEKVKLLDRRHRHS